ncbi:GTP pyrophosphokinase [Parasporobacterium paucivorans]|uniref:Putative GTP pyrophosphokinase n=1 Tax=Parasporobacterium paucivorans DSM 15970 TaxID=1122934 RepID=A0A1M6A6N4_9FIRM|nr:GTP pyrophosphokinase family protein [Parasporobacterium paucivorans]SHI32079.1 putative GTP pyrophosphokinase [Parasporobacterium paucivorans DSM 15970]
MEIQFWREILEPYQLGVNELLVKFNHIIDECKNSGRYSPIESVEGRVKKISSILDKVQRKKLDSSEIDEKIEDIAGIRIICQFVEDIYDIVKMIHNRNDMIVKLEKDYVNDIKESGYRSFHMIVYYNVETLNGPKVIQVEIQIRTMGMDFWATIEHSLQYKYKYNIPPQIRERLSAASAAIIKLDNEMSSVHQEIRESQSSFRKQANIVRDILNNIQNLFKIANKREIIKIQEEFYEIYRKDDQEALMKFGRELDLLAESYKAQDL